MTALIVGTCIVLYFIGVIITGFYTLRLSEARRWATDSEGCILVFGSIAWPIAWLIMLGWWISTKMKVPE